MEQPVADVLDRDGAVEIAKDGDRGDGGGFGSGFAVGAIINRSIIVIAL